MFACILFKYTSKEILYLTVDQGTVLLKNLRTHLKLEYNIKSLNYI